MSIYRFLLALSVVLIHLQTDYKETNSWYTILAGNVSVKSFFILSGFYMALIINEKYIDSIHPYYFYIRNRFLRIYPLYWLVLFITVTIMMLTKDISISSLTKYDFSTILYNITLIIPPNHLMQLERTPPQLLVYPAWTLSLEFTFYLIAPLIVKRKARIIFILILCSFILRFLVLHSDLQLFAQRDYGFLPNFIYFTLGIGSYKLHKLLPYTRLPKKFRIVIFIIFSIFTLFYDQIPIHLPLKNWLYYLLVVLLLPLLFKIEQQLQCSLLGDLSYPLYISHVLVIFILQKLHINTFFFACFSCVLIAYLLHRYIQVPINRRRTLIKI